MFTVRPKTAEALYGAQRPSLRRRLRLDVSPSFSPNDLRGELDVDIALSAIGERTLQVMSSFADDQVLGVEQPPLEVLLMPGPDTFEESLEQRLRQGFGLSQSPMAVEPATALQLLGKDFANWVATEPKDAQVCSVHMATTPQFKIWMHCEPLTEAYPNRDTKNGPLMAIDPTRLGHLESGSSA